MANYECRPTDGTSLNSAADSYNATHTHDDFSWDLQRVDLRIESNAAVVSFKAAGESSFGDDQKLATGHHAIGFGDNPATEVRIKNFSAGNTADYQITGFPL